MTQQPIRFDDGAAYERMMGAWSRLVGHVFLDWLSPATDQRWIDVGCGNTESRRRGSFSAAGPGKNAFHRRWPRGGEAAGKWA
jgi:hypothetical protein